MEGGDEVWGWGEEGWAEFGKRRWEVIALCLSGGSICALDCMHVAWMCVSVCMPAFFSHSHSEFLLNAPLDSLNVCTLDSVYIWITLLKVATCGHEHLSRCVCTARKICERLKKKSVYMLTNFHEKIRSPFFFYRGCAWMCVVRGHQSKKQPRIAKQKAWALRPCTASTTGLVLQVYLWQLLTSAEDLSAAPKVSLCVAPRQGVSVPASQSAVRKRERKRERFGISLSLSLALCGCLLCHLHSGSSGDRAFTFPLSISLSLNRPQTTISHEEVQTLRPRTGFGRYLQETFLLIYFLNFFIEDLERLHMCAEFHKPRSKQELERTVWNLLEGAVDTFRHTRKVFSWMFPAAVVGLMSSYVRCRADPMTQCLLLD